MTLYSTKSAAEFLGISHRTLEGFRVRGGGPVYTKLGRRVLYFEEDLVEWATKRRRYSTSDEPMKAA